MTVAPCGTGARVVRPSSLRGCSRLPHPGRDPTPLRSAHVRQGARRYPRLTASASRPLALRLSPVAQSVPVERLARGRPLAAQRIGAVAALFGAGGPARAGGVLYAPAADLVWHRGNVVLFVRTGRIGKVVVPAGTALALGASRLTALDLTLPHPTILPCARLLDDPV